METVNKYKWVILVVLPILILVLIKSIGLAHFKSNAYKWAEPSVNRSNIINTEQLGKLKGELIIINLDGEKKDFTSEGYKSITISEDSILIKANLRRIKNNPGPALLYSEDLSKQARVWMVLSQLGNKNIFILTDKKDDEVMKYKFRPDTLVKPDL
jgi:hypothetical protein